MDRQWVSRSTRYGLGGGQSGRYRRKGFRSERRVRPDRVAGSWWGQAAISHSQQRKPSLYTDHVIYSNSLKFSLLLLTIVCAKAIYLKVNVRLIDFCSHVI